MSNDKEPLEQYVGQSIPFSFDVGFVVLSFAISTLGAGSTLELIHRRTSLRGAYNLLLLVGAAISMQGIAIWSMHFIANRSITLLNGEPELQIIYSVRTTVLSFFVPIAVLLGAFLAVNINETIRWWRVCLAGVLSGSAICGMHYLGDASISNYRCSYNIANVVGAAVIAITASTAALALFFVFTNAWTNSTLRRVGCAFFLAGAVSGMHWCAALGTSYTLQNLHGSKDGNASRNTTVIAVICLAFVASCGMITAAICTARARRRYATKAQQIVLAAAVFDDQGRILVSPDGMLPSEMITDVFPQKSSDDIFSTAHPLFHWMYRVSRIWSNVANLLGWMKAHLDRLPRGSRRGVSSIKLVEENGQLVENYEMIFRELFCVAASTLAARMGEGVTNAGALWDEIFATGRGSDLGPVTDTGSTADDVSVLQGRETKTKSKPEKEYHDSVLETGLRPSQDLIGRGSLLFLVRHVRGAHEVGRLEASGFRFAEPRRVADIIRSRMQIRTPRLKEKLSDMASYKGDRPTAEPAVHLGLFALRARVDRLGFDILVPRGARSTLPTVMLPLKALQQWHQDLLQELDGLSMASLLRKLELMNERPLPEAEFAAQLRGAIAALRNNIDIHVCDEALFSAKVVQMPCRSLGGTSSSRSNTCPLITLQVMLNVNTTVHDRHWAFVPLEFFKMRQLVYEHSRHHAVLGRALHRDISVLVSSLPQDSVNKPGFAATSHKSSSTTNLCDSSARSGKSEDEIALNENSSSGYGQSGPLEPTPVPHHLTESGSDLSSRAHPSLFGGIMVSQEVEVVVQEADAVARAPSRPSLVGRRLRSTMGISKNGRSAVSSMEMSRVTSPVSAQSGAAQIRGGWNVQGAEDEEETTFLDELFATCVETRRP